MVIIRIRVKHIIIIIDWALGQRRSQMSADLKDNGKNEFTFIEEQIIPRKKSKAKKLVIMLSSTIGLAVVFGMVASYTFIVSEPYMKKILGINEDKANISNLPSNSPEQGENNAEDDDSEKKNEGDNSLPDEPNNEPGTGEKDPSGEDNDLSSKVDSETNVNNYYIEKQIPATADDYVKMFSDMRSIATEASSSIVTITCITSGVDWLNNPYESSYTLSGLIVNQLNNEYMILTNWSKIMEAQCLEVTLAGTHTVEASLHTYDEEINLAIISVPVEEIPSHVIDKVKVATLGESYSVSNGTPVIAIGNPNGYIGSLEIGMITSKSGVAYITDNKLELFTTDMLYHENGDGFIINLSGQIIGVITHTLKNDLDDNICTAIGITRLKTIIDKMVTASKKLYFGIKAEDMPQEALSSAEVDNGIYVTEVETNSPAYEAGIQSGDIIVAVDEHMIGGVSSFTTVVANYKAKDTMLVKVRRITNGKGKDLELTLTLIER